MKELWKDSWDDRARGPLVVDIALCVQEQSEVDERVVQRFISKHPQEWYAEPIRCIKRGEYYFVAGFDDNSRMEACIRLDYKDLLIVYMDFGETRELVTDPAAYEKKKLKLLHGILGDSAL